MKLNNVSTIVLVFVISLAGVLLSGQAAAQEVELEPVRRFGLPSGFDPFAASVSSSSGGMVLYLTQGAEQSAQCMLVVVDDVQARALTYRHQDRATTCLSVLVGDEGELIIRGVDPTIMTQQVVTAFTSSISKSGDVNWFVSDTELVSAKSRSEGGTGEFIGDYGGAMGVISYVGGEDPLVMAFSQGSLRMGLSVRSVPQAHIVEADMGRLQRSGQGFGQGGAGLITRVERWPRISGERVLLYESILDGVGGRFYLYNGRSTVDAFAPSGEDWSRRRVLSMDVQRELGQAALLWVNTSGAVYLLVQDTDENQPLYEIELASDYAGGELGEPQRVVMGSDYTVVEYAAESSLYYRIMNTGSGAMVWEGFRGEFSGKEGVVFTLMRGDDGALHALEYVAATQDVLASVLREVVVEEDEDMGGGVEDMSPDMTGDMTGAPEVTGVAGSGFCAVAPVDGRGKETGLWWMLGLLGGLFGWRVRGVASKG